MLESPLSAGITVFDVQITIFILELPFDTEVIQADGGITGLDAWITRCDAGINTV